LDGGSTSTPYNWPSEGIIEFKNVNFRYREHLPLALSDLSLDTKAREKVGIVGRTGSGKSSLFHVLFRTFDIDSGRISIDGVDTKILNLVELRRHLTIIPQQPFLFSGTVRENLDPLAKRSDADLWDALKKR
jgi:ABC-type multidrug transport system fused ATPase/permease subunit